MVVRLGVFYSKSDRHRIKKQGFVACGAGGAKIVTCLKNKLISSGFHLSARKDRAVGASVVIGDHFGQQNRSLSIEIIKPDRQSMGRHPARGIKDMGGQVSLGHGIPAGLAAPFLCNRLG